MIIMMMMIYFCGMADQREAFSLISSGIIVRDPPHLRSPRTGFEPAQNLNSGQLSEIVQYTTVQLFDHSYSNLTCIHLKINESWYINYLWSADLSKSFSQLIVLILTFLNQQLIISSPYFFKTFKSVGLPLLLIL